LGRLRTTCACAVTTCCGSRGFAVGEWEIVLLYNSAAHLRCGLFVSVSNPVMTIVARSAQPGNRVACFGKPVLVPWGHRAYLTRIWYTSTLPPLLAALQDPWGAAGRSTAAVVGPDVPPSERVGRLGHILLAGQAQGASACRPIVTPGLILAWVSGTEAWGGAWRQKLRSRPPLA